jgi:hypothetical protein
MCGFKNKLNTLVEIVVPANSTQQKIQFTDQPYLRSKMIYGLETYSINDVPVSPQGNGVASTDQMSKAYLTLYTTDPDNATNQGQWIQDIPMWEFHSLQNAANDPFSREKYLLDGQTIIWEKSFIILTSALGSSANVSFLFNVRFDFAEVKA